MTKRVANRLVETLQAVGVKASHRRIVGAVAILAGVQLVSATADAASPQCGPRTALLDQLAKQYKEAPAAVGLANGGALVEVLTSEDGATWTIVVSRPDGTSCLVAAGQEWQALKHVASHELGI
jgi:hypothetical protein